MLVRDVMTAPAVTVRPDAALKDVAVVLDEHRVTALPVVDDHQRLVGVISEADVVRDAVPADPWDEPVHASHLGPYLTRVGDVMSYHPVTVSPDTELAVAADLLVSTVVKSLPVVEGGVVVGVISRRDIIAVLAHRDDRIATELLGLVGEAGDDWEIEVEDGVVRVSGVTSPADREIVRVLAGTVAGAAGIRFT
jgi:CBS domain-containing protein